MQMTLLFVLQSVEGCSKHAGHITENSRYFVVTFNTAKSAAVLSVSFLAKEVLAYVDYA